MTPLEAARDLANMLNGYVCPNDYCAKMADGDNDHSDGCPSLAMPQIVAILEERDLMLASMARVWEKAQGAHEEGTDARANDKQYVEMGDILYHATNGQQGACGKYGGPPCSPWPEGVA